VRTPRTATAAVGLTALLALSACGGGDADDTASPSPTTASPSPTEEASAVVLSEEELEARLLTLDDLPSGFVRSAVEDDTTTEEDEGPGLTSENTECQAFLEAAEDSTAASTASVAFESDEGAFVQEDLESYEDDGAEQSLSSAREGLAACDNVSLADTESTLTVQEESFEDYGDETLAARFTGEVDFGDGQTVEFVGHVVSVRVVNNVINLTVFSFAGADVVDVEELVEVAVEKFTSAATPTASPTDATTASPTGPATTTSPTGSPTASPTASPTS
jgi:hypothetical protein